jgi:ketosteroid isomerase-like protein
MSTTIAAGTLDRSSAEELSGRLARVFVTADAGDLFTEDLFLDGHPPFWRFQLQGVEAFAAWLQGFVAPGSTAEVRRTIPTAGGFVTELLLAHGDGDQLVTGRELMVCEVRDGRIAELTVFCSGDWDAELRARHAAEAPMVRP